MVAQHTLSHRAEQFVLFSAHSMLGITITLVGHPFDTIKTRMQTSPRGYYTGLRHCVRETVANEGFRGKNIVLEH